MGASITSSLTVDEWQLSNRRTHTNSHNDGSFWSSKKMRLEVIAEALKKLAVSIVKKCDSSL